MTCQCDGKRRLACAAEHQIADAYNRNRGPPGCAETHPDLGNGIPDDGKRHEQLRQSVVIVPESRPISMIEHDTGPAGR